MRVKICGITNLEDALLCQSYGADALGFVFYQQSLRYLDIANAAAIIEKLSVFITKVGIFVNETPEFINNVVNRTGLTAVQLHGDEPAEIQDKINYPLIKSFRIQAGFNFSELRAFEKSTILLDTYAARTPGGTGKTFDWQLIPVVLRSKIILAGGISSKNIETIAARIKPHAVDLSSALETNPGKKDPEKVRQFFMIWQRLKAII